MITADTIRQFAPAAWHGHVDALAAGRTEIEAAGIVSPLVWSHFISQIAHESGGLTFVREDAKWTGDRMRQLWPSRFPLGKLDPRIIAAKGDEARLANLAYSGRHDLGNEGGDDGWLYRGGGLVQLTGRAAYRRAGAAIGVDLESNPEAIENPAIGLKVALWYWQQHDLGRFAAHNYGRAVGNGINRGNPFSPQDPIGYQDREQWFRRAWALWGGEQHLPDELILHLGAYGPHVANVQMQLKRLGYPVGAVDGVLGPAAARAIAGFKVDQRRALEPEEAVGPLTLAALANASPAPLSPDRTGATVATLAQAGSTEVATGRKAMGTGTALTTAGIVAGAAETGVLDGIKELLGNLPQLQTVVAPVITAVQWGTKNALWVAVIIGGGWLWIRGRDVILARLEAHRTGANLGR
jgi:putative chitinase